jgi:hypothetical protein
MLHCLERLADAIPLTMVMPSHAGGYARNPPPPTKITPSAGALNTYEVGCDNRCFYGSRPIDYTKLSPHHTADATLSLTVRKYVHDKRTIYMFELDGVEYVHKNPNPDGPETYLSVLEETVFNSDHMPWRINGIDRNGEDVIRGIMFQPSAQSKKRDYSFSFTLNK